MEHDGLACCENLWCGQEYAADEGWDGYCPSCVALLDEHLARSHRAPVPECVGCRRTTDVATHRTASA